VPGEALDCEHDDAHEAILERKPLQRRIGLMSLEYLVGGLLALLLLIYLVGALLWPERF
jgi:K+-transporting ATPase KdpF subunit